MKPAVEAGRSAALYFSGTGNTRYAVRRLAQGLGMPEANVVSVEDDRRLAAAALATADTVVIAYPNYMCVLPKIMSDYLQQHRARLEGKSIITLVTYARFSFDADLLATRLLRKLRVPFTEHSGIAIQMPFVICDMKLLRPTEAEAATELRARADAKLDECAVRILGGDVIHDGRPWMRPLAFLRQRMFYQSRIQKDFSGLRVNSSCIACGSCVRRCPTENLALIDGRIEQAGRCTQCYRCANLCPSQAITLWGRAVQWQYKGP
ncbi:MAG: EFR1 family ferrodoxin [Coriobacteriales bacterium]|nr:EFR1 family ferrodoxin [Coriobacteriales bacterium]